MTIKRAKMFLAAFPLWLWASAGHAETMLVTKQEALLPPYPMLTQRGPPPGGPKIEITASQADVAPGGSFDFTAVFAHPADIDPKTVHIILLRGDGVDVTDRVRDAGRIDRNGIDLKGLVAPAGEYRIRVTVEDTQQHTGFADVTLKVAAPR